MERQVGAIGLRISYIGAEAYGLNYTKNINKPQPSLTPFSASRNPYPQFVTATYDYSNGQSEYNALGVAARRKVGGLTLDWSWTWANGLKNTLNTENPYAPLVWGRGWDYAVPPRGAKYRVGYSGRAGKAFSRTHAPPIG